MTTTPSSDASGPIATKRSTASRVKFTVVIILVVGVAAVATDAVPKAINWVKLTYEEIQAKQRQDEIETYLSEYGELMAYEIELTTEMAKISRLNRMQIMMGGPSGNLSAIVPLETRRIKVLARMAEIEGKLDELGYADDELMDASDEIDEVFDRIVE